MELTVFNFYSIAGVDPRVIPTLLDFALWPVQRSASTLHFGRFILAIGQNSRREHLEFVVTLCIFEIFRSIFEILQQAFTQGHSQGFEIFFDRSLFVIFYDRSIFEIFFDRSTFEIFFHLLLFEMIFRISIFDNCSACGRTGEHKKDSCEKQKVHCCCCHCPVFVLASVHSMCA